MGNQEGQYRLIARYVEEESLGLALAVNRRGPSGQTNLQLSDQQDVPEQRFTLERVKENARVAPEVADTKKSTVPLTASSEITVYPNPFVDKVCLSGLGAGAASGQVRDALG